MSNQKQACGMDIPPPPLDLGQNGIGQTSLAPMSGPGDGPMMGALPIPVTPDDVDPQDSMDRKLDFILSKLDFVADRIEDAGMPRFAEDLDVISNSLGIFKRRR